VAAATQKKAPNALLPLSRHVRNSISRKVSDGMSNYRLTPDAQSDLIEIRRFTIEQWGRMQSRKYLSELRQTIRVLAETPSMGKSRPDVGSDVWSFPHVSHVVYYVMREQQLVVFGVLHKRMVPTNHLAERGVVY
jgi:toxin ParE1/3/4